MSRIRNQVKQIERTTSCAKDVPEQSRMIEHALDLFGDKAPTAVALCGIEAWIEGNDQELEVWANVYNRLRN